MTSEKNNPQGTLQTATQFVDLMIKSTIAILVIGWLLLMFFLPASWALELTSRVQARMNQMAQAGMSSAKIGIPGLLETTWDPKASTANVANLLGAKSDVLAIQEGLKGNPELMKKLEPIVELITDSSKKAEAQKVMHEQAALQTASALPKSTQPLEGWVFVGRINESGQWAPRADDVSVLEGANQNIKLIKTRANVTLFGKIDGQASEALASQSSGQIESLQFIIPGTQLSVSQTTLQPSIGNGKLVWCKVVISAERVLVSNLNSR